MTTSVLPPRAMASEAQTTTSAVPQRAGTMNDKRFSEALSRRLKRTDDAPDTDGASAHLPDVNATGHSALTHATLEPAELNAQIAAQVSHAIQSATPQTDAATDIAPAHARSIAQPDIGRTLRFAPHTTRTTAIADVKTEGAAPDDIDTVDTVSAHTANHPTVGTTHNAATFLTDPFASTPAHVLRTKSVDTAAVVGTPHTNAQDAPTQAVDSLASSATSHDHSGPAHDLLTSAQPIAVHNTSASSSLPTLGVSAIAVPLHHPQWSEALSQHVLHLTQASAQGPQVAELRLDPPELGPLRIAITLHDHVAHASFVSAHAPVRLAVENALPQLQEQLAQTGISLGQTNVSDQGFFQQEEEAPTHDAIPFTVSHQAPQTVPTAAAAVRNTHALIDTFA